MHVLSALHVVLASIPSAWYANIESGIIFALYANVRADIHSCILSLSYCIVVIPFFLYVYNAKQTYNNKTKQINI